MPTLRTVRGNYVSPINWAYFIHNLRNTFGAVAGFFECCQIVPDVAKNMSSALVTQVREASDKALQSIDEAGKLSGPIELKVEPVLFEKWLREAVNSHQIGRSAAISIEWHIGSKASGEADIDPAMMGRAVREVLNNALEAMPKGGSLVVSLDRPADEWILRLRNTGQPIPADDLSEIWEPFFTTKDNKTGVGLSWTRKIVEVLGGRVAAQNVDTQGVQIELRIP